MVSFTDTLDQRCCLSCHRVLHGRSDKKFCNDQCRNIFNNQLNGSINNYMRSIDKQLRRNRRILQRLLGEKRFVVIPADRLNSNGFVFSYCTHVHTNRNGNSYRFCYDYGYLLLAKDFVRLIYKPVLPINVSNSDGRCPMV